MTNLEQHILDKVRGCLGDEKLAGAILYLDHKPIRAGQPIHVGDVQIDPPWNAYIAFLDLEPGANWGHACCYLVINEDNNEIIQVTAHMPPFIKAETKTYHLLWRSPLAPEWAVATTPD